MHVSTAAFGEAFSLEVDKLANYIGVRCPVCEKRFTDADDIVVCPICGAPHHRACYQQLGHCAFEELHIQGHVWQHPNEQGAQQQAGAGRSQRGEGLVCPSCGSANPPDGLFCQVCGTPLRQEQRTGGPSPFGGGFAGPSQANAYTAAFGGVGPNEQLAGVSARDIALFVGENSQYFLPRFKIIEEGRFFVPNFAALIFNFFYFFYRKMYVAGGILLLLNAILQIPSILASQEYAAWFLANLSDISVGITPVFTPQHNLWVYNVAPIARMLSFSLTILAGLFANHLYWRHVLTKIRRIKAKFTAADGSWDDKLYSEALTKQGHPSKKAVTILIICCVVIYFICCFLLALPLA